MDAIISMVAGLIRRRPGRQPSRQEAGLFELSGGGRVEVMGFGASAIQFHSSVHDGRGNGLVGIGRPSLPVRKRRRGKRGDMAVCDHGCLSSRSARFIRDLNRHSVRSNDIGSPRLNLATGPWTQDPKTAKVCSVLGSCSASRGWGGEVHAGIGYFANQKGGGTGPGRGEALGPLLGCLLACSLAVFISLCWTCTSGLTFACPRQSSLFAFVEPALFTPLRLADRAKSASLSVTFRFGTTPAPSPSPTLPRLPRKISHKHFTHAPQKEGPWTLLLPVRTSEIPYRRSVPTRENRPVSVLLTASDLSVF